MVVRGAGGKLYKPGGAAGRPARTAGSGVGIPASTTGSRTGAGAEAGGNAGADTGAGAGAGAATGAVGRPETTGLVGRGAAGSPAIRAGLAASGKAVDRLSREGRSGRGGVLAIRPTGVSCPPGDCAPEPAGVAAVPNIGTSAWRVVEGAGVAGAAGLLTSCPLMIVGVPVAIGEATFSLLVTFSEPAGGGGGAT